MTAFTKDTSTTTQWYQTATPAAFNHTVAAGCNLIAVAIVSRQDNAATPSCTIGGISATLVGKAINTNDSNVNSRLWILLSPTSGVKSIAISGLNSFSQGAACVVSYTGPPLFYAGAATGAGGSGTAVTFTPLSAGYHILSLGHKATTNTFPTVTPGTGETNQQGYDYNDTDGNYDMGMWQISSVHISSLSETLSVARYWQGVVATFLVPGGEPVSVTPYMMV